MKLNILKDKIGWFGKYSGYECLIDYYPHTLESIIHVAKPSFFNKVIGKIYQLFNKWYLVSPAQIQAGVKFLRKINKDSVSHILYLESNIHLLSNLKKIDEKLIGTIHIPFARWDKKNLRILSNLSNVVIMYEEDLPYFSTYIDLNKVHVIKHGIDTDFFKPGDKRKIDKNKILFVGHYLRNFDMFLKVYRNIIYQITDAIEIHFVIPSGFRKNISALDELSKEKNIFYHEKLSDEELLEQYQTSYILLMPMEDSGANTAIIQSIAVGLPVITTDVGGIKSYGGGEVFPIIPNNNYAEMTKLVLKYYNDIEYRDTVSKRLREFAINNLDWKIIAEQHVQLYSKVNSNITSNK